jgi:hypothetical protein
MDSIYGLHDSLSLPLILLVTELATHSIRTEPVFPKAIASLLPETTAHLQADQLMHPVRESTLPIVGTGALFGEILAEFSFMFEGVSL